MKSNKRGSISMRRLNMWRRYVSLLVAMVLVMGNVLPAVSEGLVPSCGKAEHTHTAECYTPETKLSCGKEETEGHAHDDNCYEITTTQLCTLEETEGHKHNDSCKTITYVPGCGTEVGAEAHAHNAACYENVPAECPLEEAEGHVHTDACKRTPPELTCTDTTEGHTHADSCYTDVMICGKTEGEGEHKHNPETCTKPESILICGTQENPGHQHTNACNVPQEEITCTLEESEGHTHGESCTEIVKELICQEPVVEAHAHSDACNTTEKILTCTQEEHSHTAECYPVEDPKPAEEPNKPEESKPAEEPNKAEAAKEIDAPRDGEPVYMGGYIQHVTVENRAAGTTEWKTIADKIAHSAADLIAAATDELKITIEYKIPGASLTETTAIDYKLPLKSNEAVIQAKEEIVYALDKVTAIGKAVTGTDGTVTITFDEEYLKANDNGTEITGTYQFLANASELNFSEEGDAVVAFQKDEANPQAVAVQLNFAKEEEGNVEDTTTTPEDTTTTPEDVTPDEGNAEEPATTPEDTTTDEDNVEDTTTTPDEVTPDEEASEETTTPEETEETEAVVENLVTFEVPTGVSVTVDNVDVSTNDFTAMAKNGTIYFVVTVEEGYELNTVKVDGKKDARTVESATTPGEYIIEGIQTDNTVVTITATVKTVETETEAIRENVVAFEVTEGAQVLVDEADVTNSTAMAKDGTIYFTVQVDEGYELTSVVVDDGIPARTTENAGEYIIENITTDETVVTVTTAVKETEALETESKIQGYLDEIAELKAQAEALDPEAEDLWDQCYTIYEGIMVVVDEADAEWNESTITDEEYETVLVAAQEVQQYLVNMYGFDPYATSTLDRNPGTSTGGYSLSMSHYQPGSYVYWQVMTGDSTNGYSVGNQATISRVDLNTSLITEENPNAAIVAAADTKTPPTTSGAKQLSYYYPGLENGDASTNVTLKITPATGYYVTRVIVACCGMNGGTSQYSCNTWASKAAYEEAFDLSSDGYITTDLPSEAFGHSSDSSKYVILICVAPIPTPLYVEYNYGEIVNLIDDSTKSAIFTNNADGWTEDGNNVYAPAGTTAAHGVMTADTQFKYAYDGSTPDVDDWVHKANTITNDAKLAAANAGYYFAGWYAEYYNDITVTENESGSYNNYQYTFAEDDLNSTATYVEGADVNLITHVKLTAQWKPITLKVTKTVDGLSEITEHANTRQTYKLVLQNLQSGEYVDLKATDFTITGDGSLTYTYAVSGEDVDVDVTQVITPGTYKIVETGTYDLTGETENAYCTTTYPIETVEVTADGTVKELQVLNSYSATPASKTLTVEKTVSGVTLTPDKKFAFTVTSDQAMTLIEGTGNVVTLSDDGKTATFNLSNGEEISITVPYNAAVSVSEDPDTYKFSAASVTPSLTTTEIANGVSFNMPAEDTTVVINNEAPTTSVTVEKDVEGIETTETFGFTAKVYSKVLNGETETYTYYQPTVTITDSNGNVKTESYQPTLTTNDTFTFNLADGDKATFANVPVGVTVEVTETAAPGYITSYIVGGTGAYGHTATLASASATAADNAIAFTNTAGQALPLTGSTGTTSYTIGGLLTILSASFFLMYNNKKRRKEGTISE